MTSSPLRASLSISRMHGQANDVFHKTFPQLLEKFMEKCLGDKDAEDFGRYFKSYYGNRSEKWGCCFRNGNLTTNNHIESFHRILKYIYFD